MSHRPALSIVVLVYNEAESVPPLLQAIENAGKPREKQYKMIFVDDSSRDRTFDIPENMHQ